MIESRNTSWQSIATAARQLAQSNPLNAFVLYKAAIAECRQSLGPNSDQLASLFDATARVCLVLDLSAESDLYRKRATQIRVFNQPAVSLMMNGII